MSKRHWLEDFVTALGIAGFLVALFWAGWGYVKLQIQQEVSEYYASEYEATNSNDKITRLCSGVREDARIECLIQATEARHKWNNDQRDLQAQEWMAYWAGRMTIASGFAAIAAIVGLWLLRRTWAETKRTADIARDIGEAQIRAYVGIKSATYSRDKNGWNIIKLRLINSGQSPALFVSGSCTIGVTNTSTRTHPTYGNIKQRDAIGDIAAKDTTKHSELPPEIRTLT